MAISFEVSLRSALNLNSDTVLLVLTGGSTTALSTYLRLLIDGCAESGTLFVAGSSSDSHDFDGVALWGPPRDDWLPWCVPLVPGFLFPNRHSSGSPREEEGFLSQLRQEERDWITHHVSHSPPTSEI